MYACVRVCVRAFFGGYDSVLNSSWTEPISERIARWFVQRRLPVLPLFRFTSPYGIPDGLLNAGMSLHRCKFPQASAHGSDRHPSVWGACRAVEWTGRVPAQHQVVPPHVQ